VILWLGLFNMNLATPKILAVALLLALLELLMVTKFALALMKASVLYSDAVRV
jgi:hypothetical protein